MFKYTIKGEKYTNIFSVYIIKNFNLFIGLFSISILLCQPTNATDNEQMKRTKKSNLLLPSSADENIKRSKIDSISSLSFEEIQALDPEQIKKMGEEIAQLKHLYSLSSRQVKALSSIQWDAFSDKQRAQFTYNQLEDVNPTIIIGKYFRSWNEKTQIKIALTQKDFKLEFLIKTLNKNHFIADKIGALQLIKKYMSGVKVKFFDVPVFFTRHMNEADYQELGFLTENKKISSNGLSLDDFFIMEFTSSDVASFDSEAIRHLDKFVGRLRPNLFGFIPAKAFEGLEKRGFNALTTEHFSILTTQQLEKIPIELLTFLPPYKAKYLKKTEVEKLSDPIRRKILLDAFDRYKPPIFWDDVFIASLNPDEIAFLSIQDIQEMGENVKHLKHMLALTKNQLRNFTKRQWNSLSADQIRELRVIQLECVDLIKISEVPFDHWSSGVQIYLALQGMNTNSFVKQIMTGHHLRADRFGFLELIRNRIKKDKLNIFTVSFQALDALAENDLKEIGLLALTENVPNGFSPIGYVLDRFEYDDFVSLESKTLQNFGSNIQFLPVKLVPAIPGKAFEKLNSIVFYSLTVKQLSALKAEQLEKIPEKLLLSLSPYQAQHLNEEEIHKLPLEKNSLKQKLIILKNGYTERASFLRGAKIFGYEIIRTRDFMLVKL